MNFFVTAAALLLITAGTANAAAKYPFFTPWHKSMVLKVHDHHCDHHPEQCGNICRTHQGDECHVEGLWRVGNNCRCRIDGHSHDGHITDHHD